MTGQFPDMMDYNGFNAPSRVECDIYDLVVHGEIPKEINGAWYRSVPDPQYPPLLGTDTFISGDGMVGRFWFENGAVNYRQRYVRTERFEAERKARRGLFGKYRNPYTDDPIVKGVERGAANTTPVYHAGKLFALKEDSRAVELDPVTLETKGRYDFGGKLRSETMTAHTRYDPDTGELYFFGYEADGLASPVVAYCVADKDGDLIREDWFETPYTALMHDFMVTKEHVIFPVFPTTADLDRIKAGGDHWIFEPERESYVGVMRRDGDVKDMRWFRRDDPCMTFHYMNGYSEGDKAHLDFGLSHTNVFPFIREASGIPFNPEDMRSNYVRWTFDLGSNSSEIGETVLGPGGDMPRVADKDMMKDYEIGYYQRFDPEVGPPLVVGPVGAGFNTISRMNVKTGQLKNLPMDKRSTVEEHIHIPSSKTGHEGYLAFVVDLHDVMGTEVWIVEAEYPENGPIARIEMPMRLRCQVHGNWVDGSNF